MCVCSDHQQAMAERVSLSSMLAKSQSDLPPKTMKDSYLEVHLPLGSEPQLREKYLTFHNTVRYTHTHFRKMTRMTILLIVMVVYVAMETS